MQQQWIKTTITYLLGDDEKTAKRYVAHDVIEGVTAAQVTAFGVILTKLTGLPVLKTPDF